MKLPSLRELKEAVTAIETMDVEGKLALAAEGISILREFALENPRTGDGTCFYCLSEHEHRPGCLWQRVHEWAAKQ